MAKSIRYVGLDVHADTIAVAIAEGTCAGCCSKPAGRTDIGRG